MKVDLCEKCQTETATVHLTLITPSAEVGKHHYCETCYRVVQEEQASLHPETSEPTADWSSTSKGTNSPEKKTGGSEPRKRPLPKGAWTQCVQCATTSSDQALKENLMVCPHCQAHFHIGARERIRSLLEAGSFEELDVDLLSANALPLTGTTVYKSRLANAQAATGEKEAVITGIGNLGGHRIGLGVMNFSFLGGSMGLVVGEKVTRLIEKSTDQALPLVIISASVGARMSEGTLSLMQMAKVCGALAGHDRAGLPYISVLTDPTMAGVLASLASLGGLILSEPGAKIGFADERVIKQITKTELPPGFQTAEFLLERGLIDAIVPRHELKKRLIEYLGFMAVGQKTAVAAG